VNCKSVFVYFINFDLFGYFFHAVICPCCSCFCSSQITVLLWAVLWTHFTGAVRRHMRTEYIYIYIYIYIYMCLYYVRLEMNLQPHTKPNRRRTMESELRPGVVSMQPHIYDQKHKHTCNTNATITYYDSHYIHSKATTTKYTQPTNHTTTQKSTNRANSD